jgi:predicted O-linked N-acetylglucosamine transferase (SPINDLY family)
MNRAAKTNASQAAEWSARGNALSRDHQWSEAVSAYQRSLALFPFDPATWNNLATAWQKQGDLNAAEQAFQRAMVLAPTNRATLANYACLLCCRGERDRAGQWLTGALGLDLNATESWQTIGDLWQLMGEWRLAADAYRRASERSPANAAARLQLGRMLLACYELSAAERIVRQLVLEQPGNAQYLDTLGQVLHSQGRGEKGSALMQQAAELSPNEERHGRLLLALQHSDASTPEGLLAAHQQFNEAYMRRWLPVASPQNAPPAIAPLGERPLRIGFVSSDFGQHPTGFLVLPGLEHLDRQACSVVCYCDRDAEDEFTHRFRAASSEWRWTANLADEQLAALVRHDKIDLLVDLMGHTGSRLGVFARRPAPLQMTWFGYVGTTGLAAMDLLLADRYHVGAGEETQHTEAVLRMPNGYACYGPPLDAPDVSPLPALSTGVFTFGCFNKATKYCERLFRTWAAILARVPKSRLLLKAGGVDDDLVQAQLRRRFVELGINEQRLLFAGWSPQRELLAAYSQVDLALDTFPYSGGLTTCEALWMGVPTITYPGRTFAGRHGTSHLANAGCQAFIANDEAGYIELAVEWASKITTLAELRPRLRDQMQGSPLCDAPRFARDLLALLRQTWQQRAAMR